MVGVAQLVEHWVVVPGVAGSSPVTHPTDRPRSPSDGSVTVLGFRLGPDAQLGRRR
jgi:hypothetical protein